MKKGDLFRIAPEEWRHVKPPIRTTRIEYAGEQRPPLRGEWFISGAIPEGYTAFADLSTPYPIGRLVTIETHEVVKEVIE